MRRDEGGAKAVTAVSGVRSTLRTMMKKKRAGVKNAVSRDLWPPCGCVNAPHGHAELWLSSGVIRGNATVGIGTCINCHPIHLPGMQSPIFWQ